MGATKGKSNSDHLEKILREGGITRQQGGEYFDESEGQWVTTKENINRVREQADRLEKILQSS